MTHIRIALAGAALSVLAACGSGYDAAGPTNASVANTTATAAPSPSPSATASPVPTVAGFDPEKAPVANPTLGAWPYFGIMDGYERLDAVNIAGSEQKRFLEDVAYDRWEFFDGTKLIPVEGRTMTTGGKGDGASFFQVQKTYEKLVHDLGGVTVYEGSGKPLKDKGLMFADKRFRANYIVEEDQMGVYMLRTPSSQIWVEVYHPWEDNSRNYWLTIVEKKALEVKVKLIPAAEMKQGLDTAGHVALYLNFDTDKTAIKPDSQPAIAEIVKLMKADPALKLTIEGHTDNAGAPAHNQSLSDGRAAAVMAAIVAQGIPASRLQAKGLGQSKPIADNATEDGKAKNRRVELVKR
ncbi:OmpA family protein [Sphingomonas sp. KR3-1]|uniref:OmpA family protein n=1 Tax=Sphingomonas sp. KR3-1 TaxID=3156611 RepID=UPI0032B4A870